MNKNTFKIKYSFLLTGLLLAGICFVQAQDKTLTNNFHMDEQPMLQPAVPSEAHDVRELFYGNLSGSKINSGAFKKSQTITPAPMVVNGPCTNMDFENGSLFGWQGTYSKTTGELQPLYAWANPPSCGGGAFLFYASRPTSPTTPKAINGIVQGPTNNLGNYVLPTNAPVAPTQAGHHSIMGPGAGNDRIMSSFGVNLPRVYPGGGSYSLRLGNDSASNSAETVSQTFKVTSSNDLFNYHYAVVLFEGFGHNQVIQPYFKIRMYDQYGGVISCASFDVDGTNAAQAGLTKKTWTFHTPSLKTGNDTVLSTDYWYNDWKTVSIPLTAYLNQNVTIEFTTSDCGFRDSTYVQNCLGQILIDPNTHQQVKFYSDGTHFAYAYIDAECLPMKLDYVPPVCPGETGKLTAPNGMGSYSWSGPGIVSGGNTQTVTVNQSGNYMVTMTTIANTPCQATLDTTLVFPDPITANPSSTPATCGKNNGTASISGVAGGTSGYTYSWNSGGNSTTENNLAPGNYVVTITDSHACTHTESATVTQPAPLGLQASNVNVSCFGVCDGQATVVPAGGTAPYTFSWSNNATDPTVSGLCAGNYTVTLTDFNSCKHDTVVVIIEPSKLKLSGLKTDVSCHGACDGQASVSSAGGTYPYSYSWTNSSTDAAVSALCANTYSVMITDNHSCKHDTSFVITEPTAITLTKSATPAPCGNLVGSATVNAGGGTPGYTYSWNNGGTNATISNLGAGTYKVVVKDTKGCIDSIPVVVQGSTAFTATPSSADVLCFGGNNGSASVTVNGGVSPFTYSWKGGGQSTASVSGLTAGTYTCVVKDNSGSCADTLKIVVHQPTPLQLQGTGVNPVCHGVCDGQAGIIASGGTSPYAYSWSNTSTNAGISGLCAATYSVTLTDKNSCKHDTTIVIKDPAGMTFTKSSTPATCGQSTGTASATVSGGTSPYTYLWNTGATALSISNLAKATYTLKATDSKGCIDSVLVPVAGGSAFKDVPSSTNILCYGGNDGSASVTVNGGTPPYNYSWSNGGTNSSVTGLVAGTYKCTVNDNSNSCADTLVFVITQPSKLVLTGTSADVTCNGACDGKASIVPSGGTTSYSYSWTNSATTSSLSALCAGNYSVTLTDKNSCKHDTSFVIAEPTAISLAPGATPTTCGKTNGSATIGANGGTPAYSYLWDNGATATNISNVASGTYTVTVKDTKGCTKTVSVVVPNSAPFQLATAPAQVKCFNDKTAGMTANVTGTSSPYTYAWSNGATTASITNIGAGTYSVIVTDQFGCSATASDKVTQPTALILTSAGQAICEGQSATLTAIAAEGTGAYTYVWNNSTTAASYTVNPTSSNTYTVKVTDANGCTTTLTETVNVTPLPHAAFSGPDVCLGIVTVFKDSSYSAGGTSFSRIWNYGDGTSSDKPMHNYTTAGTYTVTLTVTNGTCQSTVSHVVNVHPHPIADFNPNPASATILNPEITFFDLSSGGVTGLWSFGEGTTGAYIPGVNPVHSYPTDNTVGGATYRVKLQIVNQFGCPDTISKLVYIQPEWTFYVPNTFTPNGDGKNDLFFGTGIGIIEKEMWIFDRWGNQIFHTNDLYGGWDGKVQGGNSNEIAQEDTYVWLITIKDVFLKTHKLVGHVNIIR